MPSSTSSSERAGLARAAATVVRAGGPSVLVAAALLALAWLAARQMTAPTMPRDLEGIVVVGQRERAGSIPDVDVLVIGDSSALIEGMLIALETAPLTK